MDLRFDPSPTARCLGDRPQAGPLQQPPSAARSTKLEGSTGWAFMISEPHHRLEKRKVKAGKLLTEWVRRCIS